MATERGANRMGWIHSVIDSEIKFGFMIIKYVTVCVQLLYTSKLYCTSSAPFQLS